MKDCLKEYKAYLADERSLSLNTLECYLRDIRQYKSYIKAIGINEMHLIDESTIRSYLDYIEEKGISTSTILRKLSSLRSYYKFLVHEKGRKEDPTEKLEGPKIIRKLPNVLTISEINKLLAQPEGSSAKSIRDKAMLEILYNTGIRVSELILLDLKDINMKERTINCCGCNNERVLNIDIKAFSYLELYLDKTRRQLIGSREEESLFVNLNGRRMTRQGFWKITKYYTQKAKLDKDITPHTLRHSYAIHLLNKGADIQTIQGILGHSDLSTTQMYTKLKDSIEK